MPSSLTAIANKYGTDKGTKGPTDDWRGHAYTDVYEAYLWPMRDRPIRLLEIGLGVVGDAWPVTIASGRNVGGGGSIKMWAEYFPNAEIIGIDINPASHLDSDRIATFVADQGDPAQLRAVAERYDRFDIIVDDGSHEAIHQQITFAALFPHLRDGGLYFIEDLLDNGTEDLLSTRSVFRSLVDTGRLGTPNAIGELSAGVGWVHFHAPAVGASLKRQRSFRRPVRALTHFGDEELAVVSRAGGSR